MIKPYPRDLINDHKPTMKSNNEENDRAEWKIQLVMQNNFISDKNFEDTRNMLILSMETCRNLYGQWHRKWY